MGENIMAFLATFVQDGNSIDYIPTVDVPAGSVVVQGKLVGITRTPLKANEIGSLAVVGVFDMKKGATAMGAGVEVFWDEAAKQATTSGTVSLGKSIKAAAAGDETVRVLLG
jgi:predicted RecA/RadA family phage recombinase